jgi:hypothetical protein
METVMRRFLTVVVLAGIVLASCGKKDSAGQTADTNKDMDNPKSKLLVVFDGVTSIDNDPKSVFAVKTDSVITIEGSNKSYERFLLELGSSEIGEHTVTNVSNASSRWSGLLQMNGMVFTTYNSNADIDKSKGADRRGTITISKSTPTYIEGRYTLMVVKQSEGKRSLPRPLEGSFLAYYK